MREALARSNVDAVRRSSAPSRARRATASGARIHGQGKSAALSSAGATAGRLSVAGLALIGGLLMMLAQLGFSALRRWPVAIMGTIAAIALSSLVIVNALWWQDGQHPSPLFGEPSATKSVAVRDEPLPPPRQARNTAARADATSPPARSSAAQTPPVPPASPQAIPPKPSADDPIAHLLTTGSPPSAARGTTVSSAGASNKGVLGVQKALIKLGYAITADGLNGPATRQAIAAFEKLEGLPITGDPANAAMRKALSVATGVSLD